MTIDLDKHTEGVVLTGVVLPDTTEPDLEGDVIALDGMSLPQYPVPLHWDIDRMVIGSVVLTRTEAGIVAVARVPDPARLRAPMDDLAFGIEGVIEASERLPDGTRLIQQATMTGVSVMPAAQALTRGTCVAVQGPKEEDDDDAPSL